MSNIFHKSCPQCGTANNATAIRCACGYCFDPDALAGSDAIEYEAEQQRLYLDYLEARLVQVEATAIAARQEANADPGSTLKRAQALRAEQEASAVRAEFDQYRGLSLRNKLEAPPTTKPQTNHSTSPARPTTPAAQPKAQHSPHSSVPTKPTADVGRISTAVANLKDIVATVTVATKSQPTISPVQNRATSAAPQAVAPIVSEPSTTPTESFRRMQAAKAEAAIAVRATTPQTRFKRAETVPTAPSKPASAAKPAPATISSTAAITTQACPICTATVAANAARCSCGFVFESASNEIPSIGLEPTARVAAAPPIDAKQECPNCTASVPASAKRCGCGFILDTTSEMPSVSLDAGTLAILSDGTDLRRR
jgi:hypothetical protein